MSNYPLRLPDHVMVDVKVMAARSGTSLNQFIASLVAERIGEMKALAAIEARVARADPVAALAILDHVPDRAPMAGDAIEG